MLKSIQISGFKSFAKKSVLDFTSPIVGIVGPNGSGKSNTAEAFRFVLGEQSMKSMRGKKSTDMIWSGTDFAPRSNRASVKIVFDNRNRLLDIDFDEVIIERAVHRDATNEYFINGSRVRLKDVTALLAGANIGSTGHHIISQGEADRILNASARERREMIEDALGLKIYQHKKAESEKKLDKTRENMQEVENNRRELAPHLKFLERQMKKREKGESLRIELQEKYAEYLAVENAYIESEIKRLSNIKDEPSALLKELDEKLAEAVNARDNAGIKREDANKDLIDKLSALNSHSQELHVLRAEKTRMLGQIEGQISFAKTQLARAGRAEVDVQISAKKAKDFTKEIKTEASVADKSRDLEVLRGSLRHIHKKASAFLLSLDSEKSKEDSAQDSFGDIGALEEKKQILEQELEGLSIEEKNLSDELVQVRASLEQRKSNGRDAEVQVLELNAKRSDLMSLL